MYSSDAMEKRKVSALMMANRTTSPKAFPFIVPLPEDAHRLPEDVKLVATPVLGGLHHHERLDEAA